MYPLSSSTVRRRRPAARKFVFDHMSSMNAYDHIISSDLWAIGCSTYFMIAGAPAFAAINDYQSFRKIEALDYTFPDGFYDVAKDFVQKLVVRLPS